MHIKNTTPRADDVGSDNRLLGTDFIEQELILLRNAHVSPPFSPPPRHFLPVLHLPDHSSSSSRNISHHPRTSQRNTRGHNTDDETPSDRSLSTQSDRSRPACLLQYWLGEVLFRVGVSLETREVSVSARRKYPTCLEITAESSQMSAVTQVLAVMCGTRLSIRDKIRTDSTLRRSREHTQHEITDQ